MPWHPTADIHAWRRLYSGKTDFMGSRCVQPRYTHISCRKDPALLSGQINILSGGQALRKPLLAQPGLLHWLHQIIMLGTGAFNWAVRQPCSSAFPRCHQVESSPAESHGCGARGHEADGCGWFHCFDNERRRGEAGAAAAA